MIIDKVKVFTFIIRNYYILKNENHKEIHLNKNLVINIIFYQYPFYSWWRLFSQNIYYLYVVKKRYIIFI